MSPAPPRTRVLASSVAGGVELRELVYATRTIPRHAHPTAGFCFVFDGEYEERYAARTLACSARTVTFSPAGEAHSNVFVAERSHCVTVDVPESWVERLESGRRRLREPFATRGGALAWLGTRLRGEIGGDDDGTRLVIEGLVLEMLGEAARHAEPRHGRGVSTTMQRVAELLEARFREPLSLAAIAAETSRHPVHLASAFRAAFGETIGDRVRRLRIDEASRALATSEASLAEIALASGFANQSHFTRVFKRATGMTPAVHRAATLKRGSRS